MSRSKAKSRGQVLTTTAEELRAATATLTDHHGVAVWRILPGHKEPKDRGWTYREFDPRTLRDGYNLGALSGPQSDGKKPGRSLVWFDLEIPEAVETGDRVIPAAGSIIEGRPGNPRSHRGVWIRDESIPDAALFPESQLTAVKLRARGYTGKLARSLQGRHLTKTKPGEKGQPVKVMIAELFNTGKQVNLGPTVWVSKDGTRRERREIVQLPAPDEIVTYDYADVLSMYREIVEKNGGKIANDPMRRVTVRVTGDPPKTRSKATRVRDLRFPGIEPASLNGHHKAPGAGVASQEGSGSVVVGGVAFDLEERVNRFRGYLEKLSLTEWGDGGSQCFRVARIGANDMALDTHPELLLSLLVECNNKVPEKDRWAENDLRHKVTSAIAKGRGAEGDEHPYGCKLLKGDGVVVVDNGKPADKPSKDGGRREIVTESFDTIRPKPVDWLLPNWLPLGMLTALAGPGGVGKSCISIDWAARASRGELPGKLKGKPTSVLIVAPEDPAEHVVAPRLIAANADLKRVHRVKGVGDRRKPSSLSTLTLPEDVDLLRAETVRVGAKFIIIDPVMSLIHAKIDSHTDAEARRVLSPLAELAEATGAAILLILHTNKSNTTEAADKVMGSKAFTNVPRLAMLAGHHKDDPLGVNTLVVHKTNITSQDVLKNGMHYRTVADPDDESRVKVEWLDPTDRTASSLFDTPRRDRPSSLVKTAEDFARRVMEGVDAMPVKEVKENMKAAGYDLSDMTLNRGRDAAGFGCRRQPGTREVVWEWYRLNGAVPASQCEQVVR